MRNNCIEKYFCEDMVKKRQLKYIFLNRKIQTQWTYYVAAVHILKLNKTEKGQENFTKKNLRNLHFKNTDIL